MIKNDSNSRQELPADVQTHINQLAGLMLKQLGNEGNENNIVFSPFSAYVLLTVIADATAGKTQDEITELLHDGKSFDQVLKNLAELWAQLEESREYTAANAVIVRDDIYHTVAEDYEKRLAELFSGKLFSTDNLAAHINPWVRKNSKGMISSIVDDSMKEILLCMINASSFMANWEKPYEETDIWNEDFMNRDHTVSRVEMLHSFEHTYIENEQFTGFAKPYEGETFSYVVLLPKKENRSLTEHDGELDFKELLKGVENTYAEVLMPEFNCATELDMSNLLKKLGVQTVFSPQADFSPISSEWLKASSIRHRSQIRVDREGTEAAAYTFDDMICGSLPLDSPEEKYVLVNRPFLYAVVHNASGIPVFLGAVNHLDNLDGNMDYMTNCVKEGICDTIYKKICSCILDEDGVKKDNVDRKLYIRTLIANARMDIDELKKIEAEVCKP